MADVAGTVPCPHCKGPLVVDAVVRCWRCNHRLGDNLVHPWGPIKCPKCNAMNGSEPEVTDA